jgi:arylsulfatase A-like enzyme
MKGFVFPGRNSILLWLSFLCIFVSSAFGQTTSPNIVVILADDLGYDDVGFNGCSDIPTPNINSLTANGVLCTNGYSTHPFCSPSRAGLLTGRYQQRFGHENNMLDDENNPRIGVPTTELMLSELLKPAGYVCGAVGKWHVGAAVNLHPLSRGFDEFFGFIDGSSGYLNATVLDGETPVLETAYLTDAFTREAVSFIDRHATQPFFLYLAYNAPHAPYTATPAYLSRVSYITDSSRRTYAAMIVAMDDGVGQVLAELQAKNLLNSTLIFFLSDNGAPAHTFTSNYPLRGNKGNTLEGGIRVPFAVQWTGRLPGHVVYNDPVSALDIVASGAAAAGVTLPSDRTYDGLDIIPYLAGEQTEPERNLFWRWLGLGKNGPPGSNDYIWAVRSGTLKLVTASDSVGQPPALYNLSTDIGEARNIATSDPTDVATLQTLYNQWNLETIAPLWQAPTDFLGGDPAWLVLAGDWNGFNKDDTTAPWAMPRISAPADPPSPDGFNWFTSTVHVAKTGGDTKPGTHSFALIGGNTYWSQWGGVTIAIDATNSLPAHSGSTLGPTNSIVLTDGFYYSFRILDPIIIGPSHLNMSVMKTSAPPIAVSCTGQMPTSPTSNDPVVISIGTNQPKSAEERIYVRWTNDNFATCNLVPASGSNLTYMATIPAQPEGATLRYSIISSTVDFDPTATIGTTDPLILSTTSTVSVDITGQSATPPTILVQPSNKTVFTGRSATFEVTADGTDPLSYQWMKNGTDIDGATESTYTTPPTTAADNGALFSVKVSNVAGSVTSVNAKLSVKTTATAPVITVQPSDVVVTAGQPANFSVRATGTAPLRFQWTRNGVKITGATLPYYTIAATTLADNGAVFAVTVTNRAGKAISDNATLTVN